MIHIGIKHNIDTWNNELNHNMTLELLAVNTIGCNILKGDFNVIYPDRQTNSQKTSNWSRNSAFIATENGNQTANTKFQSALKKKTQNERTTWRRNFFLLNQRFWS